MLISEAISQLIGHTDQTAPTDADQDDRRVRYLEYLREIVSELWLDDWKFKRRTATLTIPAGQGYIEFPADFLNIPPYGSVTRTDGTGAPVDWVPEYIIRRSREAGRRISQPLQYSIFDQRSTTPFEPRLQIELNDPEVVLTLDYDPGPPTLDEGANDGQLARIPATYHQLVIIPGMRYKGYVANGDSRAQAALAEYERGKQMMARTQRAGRDTLSQLPSFFGDEGWR